MRRQRRRVIRARLQRAYVEERPLGGAWGWVYRFAGQASKTNTVCSCGLCRAEKYRDRPRERRWEEE